MMKRDPSATITVSAGTGTIEAGNTEVEISHTLAVEPTAVLVTPSDGCEAPIEVPDASITDTVFKVRFVGGITLGSDAGFKWVVLV